MNNQFKGIAASLCLEISEDDGIDPKFLARKIGRKTLRHKDLQLCKEARRMIALMLADAVNHPLLFALQVVSVQPELNGQRLCVTVGHYGDRPDVTEAEVITALKPLQGVLRCALAQTINRKRTPTLAFRYAGLIDESEQGGA